MSIYTERLKERVLWASQQRGLSQAEIAERAGIGRTRFRHYFDRGSTPDSETLLKIADILEVDLNWLFGRSTTPDWPKEDPMVSIQDRLSSIENKIKS